MKDAVINIRVNRKRFALIDRAADYLGQTASQFLREAAEIEAHKILSTPCPHCGGSIPPKS